MQMQRECGVFQKRINLKKCSDPHNLRLSHVGEETSAKKSPIFVNGSTHNLTNNNPNHSSVAAWLGSVNGRKEEEGGSASRATSPSLSAAPSPQAIAAAAPFVWGKAGLEAEEQRQTQDRRTMDGGVASLLRQAGALVEVALGALARDGGETAAAATAARERAEAALRRSELERRVLERRHRKLRSEKTKLHRRLLALQATEAARDRKEEAQAAIAACPNLRSPITPLHIVEPAPAPFS